MSSSDKEPSKIPVMFDTWEDAFSFLNSELDYKEWTIREIIIPKVVIKQRNVGLECNGKLMLSAQEIRQQLQYPQEQDRIILATPGKYPEKLNTVETFKLLHEHIGVMLYNAMPIAEAARLKNVTSVALRYRIDKGLLDVIYKYDNRTGKAITCILVNDKFKNYQKGKHIA